MKTLTLFALLFALSVPCCRAQNLLQRRSLQALGGLICVFDQPSLAPFAAQFNTARQMFTSEENAAFQRYSLVAVRLGTQPPCFDKPFRVDVVGDQIIGVTYSSPGDAIACASQAGGDLAVDPAGFNTVQGLFDITAAGATAVAANQTMGVLTRVCAQFDPATGAPLQVSFETDGTASGWTISAVTSVPEPPAVNFTCGDADVPVCGTDLQTYTNLCLLNFAQRFNPGLQQAAGGACPVPPVAP